MRGKSFVRMNAPGMHSSGPRPKSHCGSPTTTSSPTFLRGAQLKCAVPAVEEPVGWQWTPRICAFGFPAGVLPLLKTTERSPFGSATEYEPWSKSQSFGAPPLKKSPKKQSCGLLPLISSGVDQVWPPSVDIEPKIGDLQKFSSPFGGCPQFGLNLKTVHVT